MNKQSGEIDGQQWRSRCFALALMAAAAFRAWSQSADPVGHQLAAGRRRSRPRRAERAAGRRAGRLRRPGAAARSRSTCRASTNALGKSTVEINQGNLRSVSVVQAGDRTRLVLNLKAPAGYQRRDPGQVAVSSRWSTTRRRRWRSSSGQHRRASPRAATARQLSLRDIDFRRGSDGAGRVDRRPAEQPGRRRHPAAGQEPGRRVPALDPARGLRRRLDVTDFGTPVQSITTTQQGDRVRMVVEPRGAWEHSAYQSDNQFVLEVRPQKVDPNKLVAGPGLHRREAVAELPEHRGPLAAAGHRRLHQLQRRHQRLRHRHRDAAPEGRALGPGARHHPAGQGPGHAQVRQRAADRAEGRAQRQGKDRARGEAADRRARAAAHAVVPAQLHQGRRTSPRA